MINSFANNIHHKLYRQNLTDMFESLRGAVHIVVMGEGFASFPVLYNHSLSKAEEKLLEDDIARISNCALFFLKKGFPFVSVLRGGFAAAHAYLSRNDIGMTPQDVLVDYDQDLSLFSQLENARQEEEQYKNAPTREKTARTLQKIIDNSMVRLTLEEQRINNLANNLAKPETRDKMKESVSNFLSKPKTVPSIGLGRAPVFLNKYSMAKKHAKKDDDAKPDKQTESTQEEGEKEEPAISPTNKINFKLPSLPSYIPSEKSIKVEGEATDSTLHDSAHSEASSGDKIEASTSQSSASKFSSAFTSLSQRVQQSKTTQQTTDKGIGLEEKKDLDDEKNSAVQSSDINESPSPSKLTTARMSSAFASFTQRMQQPTPPSGPTSGEQPADAQSSEHVKKESSSLSISKLSSFTDRIKAKSTNSPDSAVTADAPAPSSTIEKSEGEKPSGPSTTRVMDTTDGRLSKFTMSMSTSLSAMRDKVAEARADSISSNKKDCIKDS